MHFRDPAQSVQRTRGNMLGLVSLCAGLIIAVVLLGLTFNNLMFSRSHAQNEVDAAAMTLAAKINEGNRVGQINELVEASRQLVFESRGNLDECDSQEAESFSGLYHQLANEARMGQILVEAERRNQIDVITAEAVQGASDLNRRAVGPLPAALPWLRTTSPRIERLVLGRVQNVSSSVLLSNGLTDLTASDLRKRLVNPRSQLFYGNINAKLPVQDGDLDFKLASLPACVKGTTAPCRNMAPESFVAEAVIFDSLKSTKQTCDQVPSAVQILSTIEANNTAIQILSTATAHGALSDE